MDKLVFRAKGYTGECGNLVRIRPDASLMVSNLMQRMGLSACKIVSAMIQYAYNNCEVLGEEK